jgi:hypothetical protein
MFQDCCPEYFKENDSVKIIIWICPNVGTNCWPRIEYHILNFVVLLAFFSLLCFDELGRKRQVHDSIQSKRRL